MDDLVFVYVWPVTVDEARWRARGEARGVAT
jgi:hypothetical protein